MESETRKLIHRVAITGPESTGKSWLSARLAECYHTVFVPEFAREYLNSLSRPYQETDLRVIAEGQWQNECRLEREANRVLFSDTELLVIKIWSEVRYGRCDRWILDRLERAPYDLYLLCDIDLPWEYDPPREHPDRREFLFSLYLNEMKRRRWNFRIISGIGEERLRNALIPLRELIPEPLSR